MFLLNFPLDRCSSFTTTQIPFVVLFKRLYSNPTDLSQKNILVLEQKGTQWDILSSCPLENLITMTNNIWLHMGQPAITTALSLILFIFSPLTDPPSLNWPRESSFYFLWIGISIVGGRTCQFRISKIEDRRTHKEATLHRCMQIRQLLSLELRSWKVGRN